MVESDINRRLAQDEVCHDRLADEAQIQLFCGEMHRRLDTGACDLHRRRAWLGLLHRYCAHCRSEC